MTASQTSEGVAPETPASGSKSTVSLQLDRDVIEHFEKLGPDWRERINDILREVAGIGSGDGIRPENLNAENDG